jgi:hypothetical protein
VKIDSHETPEASQGCRTTKGTHHEPVARIPERELVANPRMRTGSGEARQPRMQRAFTTDPCQDQVFSKLGWTLRMGNGLGSGEY